MNRLPLSEFSRLAISKRGADDLDYPHDGYDPDERMLYVRTMIEEFEDDLSQTVSDIRDVKNRYLNG